MGIPVDTKYGITYISTHRSDTATAKGINRPAALSQYGIFADRSPETGIARNTNFDLHAGSGTCRTPHMGGRQTIQASRRRTPNTKCVTSARWGNRGDAYGADSSTEFFTDAPGDGCIGKTTGESR